MPTQASLPATEHVQQGDPYGPRPVLKPFRDWSRYMSFQPSLYFRPGDVIELKNFLTCIQQGLLPQHPLRVPGSMHSCSDIVVAETLVDVSEMPREIEFNADSSMVTATANWSLHDILIELSKRNRSLTATGGTDPQSLAGVISTNTAPATPHHSLYDTLEWVEYLSFDDRAGKLVERRVSRGDPDFPGMVGSLGAIGIITRVAFGTVEQPFFRTVQKIAELDDMLGDLDATSAKYDFWRIDWVPEMDKGLVWAAKRIPASEADPDGDYPEDKTSDVLKWLLKSIAKLQKDKGGPLLDDTISGVYKIMVATYESVRVTGPLRNMLPVDRRAPLHVAMAEWSFDPTDLPRVLSECRSYYRARGWPNLPIEIELTKTDSNWMSPWNWPGLPYIVKFNFMYLTDICTTPEAHAGIGTHLEGLWNHFRAKGIRFKAHWGKINFIDPQFLRENYQFEEFRHLIHPRFLNPYLRQRFGV